MYNHGVEYTPYTISLAPPPTLEELKKDGIKFIRIQWVDLVNCTRFRVVPISYFEKLLKSSRPGVGVGKSGLGLVYLIVAPGFSPIGEYLYVPDLKTLKICPYAPGHASVMGWFHEKTPIPGPDGTLSALVDICPRTLLDRIVKDAKSVSNVDFLVGFESEFILLKSTQPIDAVNSNHNWTASEGLPSGKVETIVLEEIADAVLASGIELQMYHPEAAPGQYEIITGPLTPLEAADALVHTREIIRNIAFKHCLRATFAPRLHMTSGGSSTHTNISVHSATQVPKRVEGLSTLESSFLASGLAHLPAMPAVMLPILASYKRMVDGVWSTFGHRSHMSSTGSSAHTNISVHPSAQGPKPVEGLSTHESSFLAGVLAHLPAMPAVTLPIPASYKRMVDGVWSGGTYVCWGTENREAPIRLVNATSPKSRRFEMRFVDGTANPYLVLATILAAGHEGIRTQQPLTVQNSAGSVPAAQMKEEERTKLGITGRLPLSWEEARTQFEKDELLSAVLGSNFVAKYLSVNKVLGDALEQDEAEEARLARLVEFY